MYVFERPTSEMNSGDLFVVKCDKTSLDLLEFLMQINYRSEGEEKKFSREKKLRDRRETGQPRDGL